MFESDELKRSVVSSAYMTHLQLVFTDSGNGFTKIMYLMNSIDPLETPISILLKFLKPERVEFTLTACILSLRQDLNQCNALSLMP